MAFGNKADLQDRYTTLRGITDLAFMGETLPSIEGVRRRLEGTARALADPKGEVGCRLNTNMIACHRITLSSLKDHAEQSGVPYGARGEFARLGFSGALLIASPIALRAKTIPESDASVDGKRATLGSGGFAYSRL